MDGLTIQQQRKAVNYAVGFLRDEIQELRQLLRSEHCGDNFKHALESRLSELRKDLVLFEELNDKLSI